MNDRLLNGARMLGALWGNGQKCRSGWLPECSCPEPTQFCKVKVQWVALTRQDGRTINPDRMIVEAMTARELEESGRTIELDNGVKIGPAGMVSTGEAAALVATPEAVPAVLKVLKAFPGAKVARSQ
jgi:hypothetical protein